MEYACTIVIQLKYHHNQQSNIDYPL
uniref:Uncharacterized protein n=1 Tax=Anguilla anguilla TaxID=7936 RepID=A0A0E9PZR5_ANGAN